MVVALLLPACGGCRSRPKVEPSFTERIAAAHGYEEWKSNVAVTGRLMAQIADWGKTDARFAYDISTGRMRLEMADGTKVYFTRGEVWVVDGDGENPRGQMLFWRRMLFTQFNLAESGVRVGEPQEMTLGEQKFPAIEARFDPISGQAKDDWIILYPDPGTLRLNAVAYRLAAGFPQTESFVNPRVATLYDYKTIDGVKVSTLWQFWQWNRTIGYFGRPVGVARISDIRFGRTPAGVFDVPSSAHRVP
jgi:hypothetical protein